MIVRLCVSLGWPAVNNVYDCACLVVWIGDRFGMAAWLVVLPHHVLHESDLCFSVEHDINACNYGTSRDSTEPSCQQFRAPRSRVHVQVYIPTVLTGNADVIGLVSNQSSIQQPFTMLWPEALAWQHVDPGSARSCAPLSHRRLNRSHTLDGVV